MIGKILGGYFGYVLTAPLGHGFFGFMLGLWLGSRFDRSLLPQRNRSFTFSYNHSNAQQVFFDASFAVMGYIAKLDGVVSEQEIGIAKSFMQQLNMNASARKEAISAFNRGKSSGFDLDLELRKLRQECGGQIILLKMFLDVQNRAASVDGLSASKIKVINKICMSLGFAPMYQDGSSGYSYSNYQKRSHAGELQEAYKTLDIRSNATDQEVKTAYRKLLGKHHPDRLMAKGLPKEMIKLANDKTAAIKKAYELIKESRRSG